LLSAEERKLRASIGALALHAQRDSSAIAARARTGLWQRYYDLVDPSQELDPAERHKRARCAMGADISRRRLAESRAKREAQESALADQLLTQTAVPA
jgi:hypothetical protein